MGDLSEKIEEYFEEGQKDTKNQLKNSPMKKIVRKRKLKRLLGWAAALYVAGTATFYTANNWDDVYKAASSVVNSKIEYVDGDHRKAQEYMTLAGNSTSIDEKISLGEKAYELVPEDLNVVLRLSEAYHDADKSEKSLMILEQAKVKNHDKGVLDYAMGISYANLGKYQNAFTLFDSAIAKGFVRQYIFDNAAVIFIDTKQPDEAIRTANYSMQEFGDTPENHTLRGIAYEMKNQWHEAIKDYNTAIHLGPFKDAYMHYVDVLMRTGKKQDAQYILNCAIELFPKEQWFKQIEQKYFLR